MPRFSQSFIDKVIDSSDMLALVSRYTRLTKKGSRYFGLCPFPNHNEKTASFTVSADKPLFYCFGCGEKGSLVDFVMKMNSMAFPEAIEYLAKEANIPIEYESSYQTAIYSSKNTLYEINRNAANYYYRCLFKDSQAMKYLRARGIGESAVKTFGLGYAPGESTLYPYLLSKGFKKKDIIASSLARENARGLYDYFRGRIMCPIQDVTGRVVGFGGRVMDKSQPKYLNSPETSVFIKNSTLYNLNRAKDNIKDLPLILVEGYMDVIALYDRGVKNVCATLGTALGENHAKLIRRFTDNVVLCYDGDAAGRNAAVRRGSILENAGLSVKVLVLPDEHDPDSYIRAYGKSGWEEALAGAVYTTDFRIGELLRQYDINDIQQRSVFLSEACEAVLEVKDEVKWDYYARKLAEIADTDISAVRSRLQAKNTAEKKEGAREGRVEEIKESKPIELSHTDKLQLEILGYLMASAEGISHFKSAGGSAGLFTGDYALLYGQIEKLRGENVFDISKKLIYNSEVTQLAAMAEAYGNSLTENGLGEAIRALTKASLNSYLKKIKSDLDKSKGNESNKEAELLEEYARIKRILLEYTSEV